MACQHVRHLAGNTTLNRFEDTLPLEMRLRILAELPWFDLVDIYQHDNKADSEAFAWFSPLVLVAVARLKGDSPMDKCFEIALILGDIPLLDACCKEIKTSDDFEKTPFFVRNGQKPDFLQWVADEPVASRAIVWLSGKAWARGYLTVHHLYYVRRPDALETIVSNMQGHWGQETLLNGFLSILDERKIFADSCSARTTQDKADALAMLRAIVSYIDPYDVPGLNRGVYSQTFQMPRTGDDTLEQNKEITRAFYETLHSLGFTKFSLFE